MENKEHLKELISGCLQNKRRSQEELFKLYYGKMLSICMRYTVDRDSAEEVLQEGFIKIFDKLEAFDYKGSFEGWMRRIMSNTAIDNIRKSKKNPILTDNDDNFKMGAENPMIEAEDLEFIAIKAELALEDHQPFVCYFKGDSEGVSFVATIAIISNRTSKSNL